jgi:glycosyltransferase involved in cell wall biosynthesis
LLGKVDLVMWAKNGARYLPIVLKRVDEVVPHENVCHKILVDDNSSDTTAKIAKDFNWTVYQNPYGGIPSGANEALRHVDANFFVSIEQDLVLAKDWWDKIPPYMENPKIAVASGVRIYSVKILKELSEFVNERIDYVCISMDNNIFKTKIIKELGGFPNDCPICTDTILYKKINWFSPYKWVIDNQVVSTHLRKGVWHELRHLEKLEKMCTRTKLCGCYYVPHYTEPKLVIKPIVSGRNAQLHLFRLFLTSPIRGLHVAIKKGCPELFFVYPLIRLYKIKLGLL